jgi:hypothetical protein
VTSLVPSWHNTISLDAKVGKIGEMRVDNRGFMGFLIRSIPAKPLAQAKLKCGGFFIALTGEGRLT